MNRPQGVTILGWIAIVFGVLGVFASIAAVVASIGVMALGTASLGIAGAPSGAAAAGYGLLAVFLSLWLLIMSVLEIVFGAGTLGLKPWAWTIGVWWCYISAFTNVLNLFSRQFFSGLIGIVVAIALLYYLFRDDVRAAFGKLDKQPPSFLLPVFEMMDGWFNRGASAQGAYAPTPPPNSYAPPAPPAAPTYAPPAPPAPPAAPPVAPPAPPADPGAPGQEPPA